jgi:hypothetical protein
MAVEWQAQQKLMSSIGRCFNCDIRGYFTRNYRKPKKEEALLVNAMKSQHCCEPRMLALRFRGRLLGINPELSYVYAAKPSPLSVRV